MGITLEPGELKELNVAMQPVAAPGEPSFMGHLYMVDVPEPDNGASFVVRCPITNTGSTPITQRATCYTLLHDVFPDPPLKYRTYEFTIEPGETYQLRHYEHWRRGARGDIWVEGEWGEQTPVMRVTFGYYADTTDAEVRATTVKATDAVVRYSQRSNCTHWEYSVYTPPLRPYEQYIHHKMNVVRDPVSSSWTAIHCILWPLLSGRQYEAYVYGYSIGAAHRAGWTRFTTP